MECCLLLLTDFERRGYEMDRHGKMGSDDERLWVESAIEEGRLQVPCSQCQTLLVRDEAEGVQVEACPTCGGIWFDGGELKKLAQTRPGVLAGLEHRHDPRPVAAPAPPRVGGRICPACQVSLREFEFPWAPGARLDGCDKCHGIWADDGELSQIEAFIARHRREHAAQAAAANASASQNVRRAQAFHTLLSRPEGQG